MGIRYVTPRPPQHRVLLVPEDGSLPSREDMNAVFGDSWRFETRPDGTTHAMVREYSVFANNSYFRDLTEMDRGYWVGYDWGKGMPEPRLVRVLPDDKVGSMMLVPEGGEY